MFFDALQWFFISVLVLLAIRYAQGALPEDSPMARALSYLYH